MFTLDVLAVPFSGHLPGGPRGLDSDGEYFDQATETFLEVYGRIPLAWHHGMDRTVGKRMIGHAENFRRTDDGWWCTATVSDPELDGHIKRLAERGELFASTGTLSHLVERDRDGHLRLWPTSELSLTPRPANLHAVARLTPSTAPLIAEVDAALHKALDMRRAWALAAINPVLSDIRLVGGKGKL